VYRSGLFVLARGQHNIRNIQKAAIFEIESMFYSRGSQRDFVQKQVEFNDFTHLNCSGYMSMNLRPGTAIDYITAKASKRLYFLKVLKRSGIAQPFTEAFYTAAIRSILDYCLVVWGHNLSEKQSSQLESIQKRAIRKTYQEMSRHMLYIITVSLHSYKTDALNKQQVSSHQFWTNLYAYIISSRRNVTRLRSAFKFPVPFVRTNKFQSLLTYGSRWYQ